MMCSSPAGRAGLDTRSPSHRVEWPCHTAWPLRDWYFQTCLLFPIKVCLGWFQDPKCSGHRSTTYIDAATISVWETIQWQLLLRMSSADRIQVGSDVPWAGFLTMYRTSLLFFYIAQTEYQKPQGNAVLRSKPEERWCVRHQPKSTHKTMDEFVLIGVELLQLMVSFTHRLVPFKKCKATLPGPDRAVSPSSNIPYNQMVH